MSEVATKIAELPEKYDITVPAAEFSPDGKHIAVRSTDQTINIWDWQSGLIVRALPMTEGANDGLTTESLRYSPNGRLFAACHGRGAGKVAIQIWRTDTWDIAHEITDEIGGSGCNSVEFTPDGKSLIRILDRMPNIAGDTLVVYDTSTWKVQWGMRTIPFYTYTLAISPDGKTIALGGEVRNPKSWRVDMPIPVFGDPPMADTSLIALVDPGKRAVVRTLKNTGVMDPFSRLVWSPDGQYLATAGGRGLQIFDVRSGEQTVNVSPPIGSARSALRYTRDGRYLIEGTAGDKRTGWGKIWDGQHRMLLQEIPGNVGSIAVSPDSRYLATGLNGKTVIWKLKQANQ